MSRASRVSEPGETRRRKSLGRTGEDAARTYLQSIGFAILQVNYRRRGGEADIIARNGRLVVFCEVKTRIGSGESREGYGRTQRRRLVELSEKFLNENGHLVSAVYELRYDLMVVGEGEDGKLEVKEHIEDAFRPE